MSNAKKTKKHRIVRANRDTPEAAVEENSKPYDEIGETDEEIRKKEQEFEKKDTGPGPVPTDGS